MLDGIDLGLDGKVALVTGGSSGIGKSAATLLTAAGCRVAVGYSRDQAKAEKAVAEIGGETFAIKADVADAAACQDMVRRTVDTFGRLDVLVHSAGISKLDDGDPVAFDRVVKVHLHSTHYLLPAALEPMRRQGGGSIVVLTSIAGNKGGASSYAAAMAGKRAYTLGFARQVAGENVRVNCCSPGTVFTEMFDKFIPGDAAKRQRTERDIPLWKRRSGYPKADDAGKVILFLASDLAGHVTGEEVRVNGGQFVVV